jgi:hypothetical protein
MQASVARLNAPLLAIALRWVDAQRLQSWRSASVCCAL